MRSLEEIIAMNEMAVKNERLVVLLHQPHLHIDRVFQPCPQCGLGVLPEDLHVTSADPEEAEIFCDACADDIMGWR